MNWFAVFGIVGWVFAIYAIGFSSGAAFTYRRVRKMLREQNERLAKAVAAKVAADAAKLEPARWTGTNKVPTDTKVN